MTQKTLTRLLLISILLLAAFFRLYGLDWDSGHHLHPDERALAITIDGLKPPASIQEFLSPQSSWNPQFFAYGSLPMYALRIAGSALSALDPALGTYTSINLLGRFLSALADLSTIIIIFIIGRFIFNKTIGLFAAFFYSISVLPIQLSHFFAVDTILTMFITLNLYLLLVFYKNPNNKNAVLIGLALGMALATKVSAIVLLAPIGITLVFVLLPKILKRSHKDKYAFFKHSLLIALSSLLTFALFMPYALIDFQNFWQQTIDQSQLTKDPFAFPYTLQFVAKIPYLYEIKNIFLWGLGPILATLSFLGIIYSSYLLFSKKRDSKANQKLILLSFLFTYSLIIGNFAVGFMRYMLPVYPLFALFAGVFTHKILKAAKNKSLLLTSCFLLLAVCLIWPLSFIQIYSRQNTRIQASNWIYKNISPDKTLAIEHWDDQLPIGGLINYNTETLKLYDPDTDYKWQEIEVQLQESDYIIIASNRLYVPLQKLTDCTNLPAYKCYPQTAEYYRRLFANETEFKKVAEFTSYPTIPIFNIPINDQSADENFTVFDHPKIMIFQKATTHSTM